MLIITANGNAEKFPRGKKLLKHIDISLEVLVNHEKQGKACVFDSFTLSLNFSRRLCDNLQ